MKFIVSETPEATAHALIRSLLSDMAMHENPYCVAFSGGNTPALLFDIWAGHYLHVTPWDRLMVFFVDERCVAPDSPESNAGNMRKHLLNKVPIPSDHVFAIDGLLPPDEAALAYGKVVTEEVPREEGRPIFDTVILGMGDDGHTSSIFPGQENLLAEQRFFVESRHPMSGQLRVAMTPVLMWAAKRLVFHVTGAGKATVLKKLTQSEAAGPAAYVAHHARMPEFFVDKAAATLIEEA